MICGVFIEGVLKLLYVLEWEGEKGVYFYKCSDSNVMPNHFLKWGSWYFDVLSMKFL